MRSADALIVGAGPAGLSVAAALTAVGRRVVVLEASAEVGGLWARVPQDMRCLSDRRYDHLPDGSTPSGEGQRATAGEVLAAWQRFHQVSGLDVCFETPVTGLAVADDGYLLTAGGDQWAAPRVVLATGEYGTPWRPVLSGEFSGPIDHSATLDLDSVDEDAHVLVVGAGNSAADWVPRLLARGARVTVSTRAAIEPPHRPASGWLGALAWRASGVDLRWVPGRGGCTESTPVIDSRLFEAVSTGRVAVVGEVVALRGAGVEVRGGETLDVDRIVFATGFVRSLGWASGLTLDERNRPQQRQGRSTDLDGVWFMGLPCMRTRRSGFLRGLRGDAQAIARAL